MTTRAAEPDLAALDMPVDDADVTAYRAQLRTQGVPPPEAGRRFAVIGAVAVFVAGLALNWALRGTAEGSGADPEGATQVMVPLTLAATVAAGIGGWWVSRRRALRREVRVVATARANGFEYRPESRVEVPGVVFRHAAPRRTRDRFVSTVGRPATFGNHAYVVGRDDRIVYHWGYVAVRLDAALPHVVLDATRTNGRLGTNLPTGFDREDRMSVSAALDDHFVGYAPRDHQDDVRGLFIPDLVAALTEYAADAEVEIVDRWIVFYVGGPLDVADPAVWRRVFRLLEVGAVAARSSARYHGRDAHADSHGDRPDAILPVADHRTARSGRRLRQQWNRSTITGGVLFGAVVVAGLIISWLRG